ncbi:MAG: TetR/AcrR family transcriptional regulator [Opitutae bacterium]|nr:TetR/AcrR family transcriptional regulator [Opitutae bacterium]
MKRRATSTRRPSPDREQRRQEILRAAIRLFAQRGMENVTFGDIAKAARLSRPLVYFYFPDLETLFLEAVIVGSGKVHQRFQHAIRPSLAGLDQIMALGAAYVQFARDEPELFQLLAHKETKQSSPDKPEHPLETECRRVFGGIMDILVAALKKGREDGSIRRDIGDPAKVAVCLWGLTHGLIQIAATQQPTIECKLGAAAATDLPDFGLDLLCRSLAAPKRRAN